MGSSQSPQHDVVVIGAGAAGLGVAGALLRRGIEPLLLERSDQVGGGWRDRYDSLRLNTVPRFSALPGERIRGAGRWMPGAEFDRYLKRYARERSLRAETGVQARRVTRTGPGWQVDTDVGAIGARSVIVAAGYDRVPVIPDWPGRDKFDGSLIHAVSYQRPEPYIERDVLVVGAGNSGTEIARELAEVGAARVRMAVRTPVNLMPEAMYGIPATWFARANESAPRTLVDAGSRLIQRLAFGDLTRYGMARSPLGIATELQRRGKGPVLDRGFVAALKRGQIELVAAVDSLEGPDVLLADGRRCRPDVVIAATGFALGLEPLVGHLGVLDDRGRPRERRGRFDPDNPGLFFNGYWLPLTGQLPAMQRTGPAIARAIAGRRVSSLSARRPAPRPGRRPRPGARA